MTDHATPADGPDDDGSSLEDDVIDRRASPGRRAVDLEHDVMSNALAAVKGAKRTWVAVTALFSMGASALTFLLMVFGLKIGGAQDLSNFRVESRRADSSLEGQLLHHDSLIAANRALINLTVTDIADLKKQDEVKMIVLCVIADKVDASTGGYCAPYTHHTPR